jgi:RNA polymerase sigma-70 factor (ECF subfamily)
MPPRPHRDILAVAATPSPSPEQEQLECIRAGDEQAFEQLFKAYYRNLCNFVHGYVRSRETAEELVQTIFLRLWEKREGWEPVAGVRAYLFAACRNQSLDYLKHQRVVERSAALGRLDIEREVLAGPQPVQPDEATHATELAEAIRRAVQELPERRRAVVVLRWQHHLTNLEIARALGISVKGVEAQVTRALVALRERLSAFRP